MIERHSLEGGGGGEEEGGGKKERKEKAKERVIKTSLEIIIRSKKPRRL